MKFPVDQLTLTRIFVKMAWMVLFSITLPFRSGWATILDILLPMRHNCFFWTNGFKNSTYDILNVYSTETPTCEEIYSSELSKFTKLLWIRIQDSPAITVDIKLFDNCVQFMLGKMDAEFWQNIPELIRHDKGSVVWIQLLELLTQVIPHVIDLNSKQTILSLSKPQTTRPVSRTFLIPKAFPGVNHYLVFSQYTTKASFHWSPGARSSGLECTIFSNEHSGIPNLLPYLSPEIVL